MEILSHPIWTGISAIVTIITALVPVGAFLWRRVLDGKREKSRRGQDVQRSQPEAIAAQARSEAAKKPRAKVARAVHTETVRAAPVQVSSSVEALRGCGRAYFVFGVNVNVFLVYWFIYTTFYLVFFLSSKEARAASVEALPRNWGQAWDNMALGCLAVPFFLLALLALTVVSTRAGLRRGFAAGAHVTTIGLSLLMILGVLYNLAFAYSKWLVGPQLAAVLMTAFFLWLVVFATEKALQHA